jgi:uncharacterized delta-60 repeat protein
VRSTSWRWLVGLLIAASSAAFGAAGDLDTSFGTGGVAHFAIGPSFDEVTGVRVQPDGKILVVGTSGSLGGSPTLEQIALLRFNADGTPDTAFGDHGAVLTRIQFASAANALALQPDGRIVVVGLSCGSSSYCGSGSVAIARYMPDGSLDPSFGSGGTFVWNALVGPATAVALQGDGKILVTSSDGYFSFGRCNGDGTPDASFGTGGVVHPGFGGGTNYPSAIAVQADGRIVVSGTTISNSYAYDYLVARFDASGAIDPTFGAGAGRVVTSLGIENDWATSLVVQGDGRLLVGGRTGTAFGTGFGMARYLPDGTLDSSFGVGGRVGVVLYAGETESLFALALQPDQRIVAVGTTTGQYSNVGAIEVARFTSAGALDPTFGSGGKSRFTLSTEGDTASSVALQPDGAIVVGATRKSAGYYPEMAVMRVTASGALDSAFGSSGVTIVPDVAYSAYTRAVGIAAGASRVVVVANAEGTCGATALDASGALDRTFASAGRVTLNGMASCTTSLQQGDGKVLVAGGAGDYNYPTLLVMRMTPDGALDASFGTGGIAETPVLNFSLSSKAQALALQSDGRVIAAGTASLYCCTPGYVVVTRHLATGRLDPAFGTNGAALLSTGSYSANVAGVAVQADGSIMVAGSLFASYGSQSTVFLARFTAAGVLDTTFGNAGMSANVVTGTATAMALLPAGGILVAGNVTPPLSTTSTMGVSRFLPNGQLDTSFGSQGSAWTYVQGASVTAGPMLASDGRIVIAGSVQLPGAYDPRYAMARWNADGTLDTSFGSQGLVVMAVGPGWDLPLALGLQRDSRIVLAGTSGYGGAVALRFENPDSVPDAFVFPSLVDQPDGTLVQSSPISPTGFNLATAISISGGEYSINCSGVFTSTPGTLHFGDTVCVRQTTAPSPSGQVVTTLTIGGVSGTFTTTTRIALATDASSLDFGGQSINTTSPPTRVMLTNTGTGPLTIQVIGASTGFSAASACGTLAAGSSCAVDLAFTPGGEGAYSGTLMVQTDQGALSIPLAGTGERSLVTHYYRSILRRAPDAGGKAFWESEALRMVSIGGNVNETWYSLAAAFYSSPEYLTFARNNNDYVTDLYRTFFNRAPDSGGLNFWTSQIASGMPRDVALVAFTFSPEFTAFTQGIFGPVQVRAEVNLVTDFYRGLLARLPDNGGFSYWVGRFRSAQCQGDAAVQAAATEISSLFETSAEYAARNRPNAQYVGDLYNAFMRRGGDLSGVMFWIGQLDTKAQTRAGELTQFVASPEFKARVSAVVAQGCLH